MSKPKKNFETQKPEPTKSKVESYQSSTASKAINVNLLFGRKNYYYMLAGVGLIIIGLFLMSGGHMPSPEVWDENLIYSGVRITLAPMIILAGLVLQVFAIFVKKD